MLAFVLIGWLVGCQMIDDVLSPEPQPITYTVVSGDTLWKISEEHGVSIEDIKQANELSSDTIEIGQVLIIPGETGIATPSATPAPASRRPQRSARTVQPAPAEVESTLHMPAEQPCLAGPTDVEGSNEDVTMAASAGLSRGQISAAMNGFVNTLSRCIDGPWPEGEVMLEIRVACTGRVDAVNIQDGGGMAPAFLSCIQDTLRYAPFPAHDLPDGETFGYPLRFTAQ